MIEYVLELLPELKNSSEDYIKAIAKKYENYIKGTQIPAVCYGYNNLDILPTKLQKLYNNIMIAFEDRYNILINFEGYSNISYLIYLFLDKYFVDSINKDTFLEEILYIDTPLLVEDYKRLIDYGKEEGSLKPVHDLNVLYKSVETAPIVFWDKLLHIKSNFDKDKILDIITIRNRRGLGNIYITTGNPNQLMQFLGNNLCIEIKSTIDLALDCSASTIQIPREKEVTLFK